MCYLLLILQSNYLQKKFLLITFADDTVIYFSHNDFHVIENTLNNELNSISEYLRDNELIINLKTGKTESMLFGTSKKLKVVGGKFSLKFGHLDISPTTRYTYLGTLIDPSLNLNENFIRTYKKASSRLRLLSVLRCYLTVKAAKDVFTMMILPLLTFNSITNLSLNRTQLDRLRSLDNRANEIVNRNSEAKVQIQLVHYFKFLK